MICGRAIVVPSTINECLNRCWNYSLWNEVIRVWPCWPPPVGTSIEHLKRACHLTEVSRVWPCWPPPVGTSIEYLNRVVPWMRSAGFDLLAPARWHLHWTLQGLVPWNEVIILMCWGITCSMWQHCTTDCGAPMWIQWSQMNHCTTIGWSIHLETQCSKRKFNCDALTNHTITHWLNLIWFHNGC
jgi:hypothetical protein